MIDLQPRGALKKEMEEMVVALRQSKPMRGRRRTTVVSQSFVPEALRIQNRQGQIESRVVPEHWEDDSIKGAYNRPAVGVLVERKTRFVVLCRMNGCTADSPLEGFAGQIKKATCLGPQGPGPHAGHETMASRTLMCSIRGHIIERCVTVRIF